MLGRLREAQDGETGAAVASLWRASLGLSPPPPRKWQKPWKFPGLLPCSEIRGLGSGGQPQPASTFTGSILCPLADAGATWASSALLQHIFTIFGGDEYMFGKKVFAAMLATVLGASLFGANAAKAQINLDTGMGAVTYATETLVAATAADLTGYSVVMGPDNILDVTAAIGLGGPDGTFVTVQFTLGGMVFSTRVMGENLETGAGHGDASLRSGGHVGEAHVSFIVTRTANTSAETVMTLSIDQLGVKPDVDGSVTMMVTDSVGDDEENAATYTNAVLTKRALEEMSTPGMDLVATVDHRFQSFGGETMGTLGKFEVGANETYRNADGTVVELGDIIEDTVAMGSSVTISGDFAFVSAAWLDADGTCNVPPDGPGLVQKEDETVLDELTAQDPSVFVEGAVGATQYLCISVPMGGMRRKRFLQRITW